jgi:hypothetical protein
MSQPPPWIGASGFVEHALERNSIGIVAIMAGGIFMGFEQSGIGFGAGRAGALTPTEPGEGLGRLVMPWLQGA